MRSLWRFIREVFCRHDWELFRQFDPFLRAYAFNIWGEHLYKCKKCGLTMLMDKQP